MGKTFDKNAPSDGSKRVSLEKDIDWHNQRLWKRKKYQAQVKKDEMRKTFREYKKVQADVEGEDKVTDKQKEFYENLFKQDPDGEKKVDHKPVKREQKSETKQTEEGR